MMRRLLALILLAPLVAFAASYSAVRPPQLSAGTSPSPPEVALTAYVADSTGTYLSRAQPVGVVDGSQFTLSMWFNQTTGGNCLLFASTAGSNSAYIDLYNFVSGVATLETRNNSGGAQNLSSTWATASAGAVHHIVVSIDLTNTAKRHVYVDGVAQSVTWTTYDTANPNIDWTVSSWFVMHGPSNGFGDCGGQVGQVWFNTSYIDLSVPANLAKFYNAGKPVYLGADGSLPTGSQPLIYLPEFGDRAGINRGTGGDYTATGTLPAAGRILGR